ncbi:MAG: phage tail protein, partial [Hyphomicrobiales bacterium]|nr:phage tail protein [Hyphomicrobiales bacterium]
ADAITGDPRLEPMSQRLAGVLIATDLNEGYHNSPSNREIKGVIGAEVDINFYPSDYQNDTNFLNEAGIVTYMRSFATGYKTFGNRSAAFPTSSHVENFIHARRILDMLHEAIIFFSMNYIDRLGTPQNVEALEEAVNAFLRTKVGDGVLYGGTYRFDRERNTAAQIADGHFHYVLECHPVSVMERLTTHSYVDTKFISNALGLTA